MRTIRILAPFFLLLLCIGALQILPPMNTGLTVVQATTTPSATPTARSAQATSTFTPVFTGPATSTLPPVEPVKAPTFTATPVPLLPPDSQIQLLGPPVDTLFSATDDVTFYWLWPYPLAVNQTFQVYVHVEDQRYLVGTVDKPNVGNAFRLPFSLPSLEQTAAELSWQVVLAIAEPGSAVNELLNSEKRSLRISAQP